MALRLGLEKYNSSIHKSLLQNLICELDFRALCPPPPSSFPLKIDGCTWMDSKLNEYYDDRKRESHPVPGSTFSVLTLILSYPQNRDAKDWAQEMAVH